ncbi:uncharacterized protein LOC116780979 isoform X1 [Chiroxiphia lanceolata]|uniref:uncharacterized protein LOC116780979 isoform X1 n=1 Tax=Chiroxiphia lanceolata TaxID=296741 RepID=UPI0013CF024E|nr:uncharacterized protein LOC116780979 isoform X1 [Chiroxiphia lanceolata]
MCAGCAHTHTHTHTHTFVFTPTNAPKEAAKRERRRRKNGSGAGQLPGHAGSPGPSSSHRRRLPACRRFPPPPPPPAAAPGRLRGGQFNPSPAAAAAAAGATSGAPSLLPGARACLSQSGTGERKRVNESPKIQHPKESATFRVLMEATDQQCKSDGKRRILDSKCNLHGKKISLNFKDSSGQLRLESRKYFLISEEENGIH